VPKVPLALGDVAVHDLAAQAATEERVRLRSTVGPLDAA
jgi:hypothetical protein